MRTPLFYHDKPVFGLDIGKATVKVVQLKAVKNQARLKGYGYVEYDHTATLKGEIVKPEIIAKALQPLLKQLVIGKLTTNRVVTSIPNDHTFTRIINIPKMSVKDLDSAVTMEAEQYIPLPLDQLYLEHTVLEANTNHPDAENQDVLLVATPKNIVSSYIKLFSYLGLEPYGLEPGLLSIMRAVDFAKPTVSPRIVIDFGSNSSDLAIYDTTVRLTSTIAAGGDHITEEIAKALNVSREQASKIKTRFGITKSQWQSQLAVTLQPILTDLANEVQKMMRYYRERNPKAEGITEITIVGGGANLPGLAEFLSHLTGVSVTVCNPWERIMIKPLQPPHKLETTLYTTAVGLALKELER